MTKHDRHIAALTTAARKAADKGKLKEKIKAVKKKKAMHDWLSQ